MSTRASDQFEVVCVDLTYIGHGERLPSGHTDAHRQPLHMARINSNHFVPLWSSGIVLPLRQPVKTLDHDNERTHEVRTRDARSSWSSTGIEAHLLPKARRSDIQETSPNAKRLKVQAREEKEDTIPPTVTATATPTQPPVLPLATNHGIPYTPRVHSMAKRNFGVIP